MIFYVEGHIDKIKLDLKTQTRRVGKRKYEVGKTYGIQPCRTCPAIKDGRILILSRRYELPFTRISKSDAKAEGGYTPKEFEELFRSMHQLWLSRDAYTFKFVPSEISK